MSTPLNQVVHTLKEDLERGKQREGGRERGKDAYVSEGGEWMDKNA